MEDFPKWTAFFDKLAARVEGESPADEFILQKLVKKWVVKFKWLWSVKIMYVCMTMTWWRH